MSCIYLVMILLSVSPETGLYVSGQTQDSVLEKAVLLEELQARLPGLLVSATPTQDQGRFYTLEYSLQSGDTGSSKLLFILKDSNNQILLKRTLQPDAQSLSTARQIALVIEGIIKRRGDALNEILLAQQPEPEPEAPMVPATTTPRQVDTLQLDAAMTFGALLAPERSTIGLQTSAQYHLGSSIYFGIQLGFHKLLADGNQDPDQTRIDIFEWQALGTAAWEMTRGTLGFSVLGGGGIAVPQSSVDNGPPLIEFGKNDVLFMMRVAAGLSWEISNDISMIARFMTDFTPSYPHYELQGEKLLSRGSTSICASLGLRYSPF